MPRLASYFIIIIAIILGAIIGSISDDTVVVRPPIVISYNTKSASSTVMVLSDPEPFPAQAEIPDGNKQTPKPASKPPETVVVAVTASPPVSGPSASELVALDVSASVLRAALVNIICDASAGSGLRSISGSGVFIDSKGIILTNAHIAQYFLLASRNVSCIIRAGSPAVDSYEASLIYISPKWIQENAKILSQANPIGTGEYDFAFLAVTKSIKSKTLTSSFSFIPLAIAPLKTGAPVVIASYAAQFLESSQIQSSLFPTVVFGSVKDIFTFGTNTIDVLALGGSAAAQEGSSGGGVADASGKLVGTITTSTTKGTTDTRKLDAITASYIRATYANETGTALDILFTQPIAQSVSAFASKIPSLESILTAQLH